MESPIWKQHVFSSSMLQSAQWTLSPIISISQSTPTKTNTPSTPIWDPIISYSKAFNHSYIKPKCQNVQPLTMETPKPYEKTHKIPGSSRVSVQIHPHCWDHLWSPLRRSYSSLEGRFDHCGHPGRRQEWGESTCHWTSLRENQLETVIFAMKFGGKLWKIDRKPWLLPLKRVVRWNLPANQPNEHVKNMWKHVKNNYETCGNIRTKRQQKNMWQRNVMSDRLKFLPGEVTILMASMAGSLWWLRSRTMFLHWSDPIVWYI